MLVKTGGVRGSEWGCMVEKRGEKGGEAALEGVGEERRGGREEEGRVLSVFWVQNNK